MATYHEELAKAGVLLDASGLQPTSKGWRVKYSGGKRIVIDGPFTEAKELIAATRSSKWSREKMRFVPPQPTREQQGDSPAIGRYCRSLFDWRRSLRLVKGDALVR
jgi:hypothetical protein